MKRGKTKEKLINSAITYLNKHGQERMSVQKLVEIAKVGYGTFYNHFDSIDEIHQEALDKTILDVLEKFSLDLINEEDMVYVLFLGMRRSLSLLCSSSSIKWLLKSPSIINSTFARISQPAMESIYLEAIKRNQIKDEGIKKFIEFQESRNYLRWAVMAATDQVVNNVKTEDEAFRELVKSINIVDIPRAKRDEVLKRIESEKFSWKR